MSRGGEGAATPSPKSRALRSWGAARPHVPESTPLPRGHAGRRAGSDPPVGGCQKVGAQPKVGSKGARDTRGTSEGGQGRRTTSEGPHAGPCAAPRPARLVSTFPAARPHSGSRGGRGGVSRRAAPPPPFSLPARATSPTPPPRATRGTPVSSPPSCTFAFPRSPEKTRRW